MLKLVETANLSLDEYPEAKKLKNLFEKERLINFEKANKEQSLLLQKLTLSGAEEDVKAFVENSKRLRTHTLSQYLLLRQILTAAESKQIALQQFPELRAYQNYLKDFAGLDLELLLNELDPEPIAAITSRWRKAST